MVSETFNRVKLIIYNLSVNSDTENRTLVYVTSLIWTINPFWKYM